MKISAYIKTHLDLPQRSIENTVELLSNDATIPFIARYRKEMTGNLDEVKIEQIASLLKTYQELEKRKITILNAVEEQGKLSPELRRKIEDTYDPVKLEDLYLPYKKKRKTKAGVAAAAGLEPLAKILMAQKEEKPEIAAKKFLKGNIKTIRDALEGAKHIIAEWINENQLVRERLRWLYQRKATISARVRKAEEDKPASQKFKQYFDWNEPLNRIPSHRYLAVYRADKEGILRVKIEVEKEEAEEIISRIIINKGGSSAKKYLLDAIDDSYKRLLKPSFQTEFISLAKKKADEEAIEVFAGNLEQLLLSPPLGEKRILAIDPGFRSGCKVVCLDEKGSLLHNETIYPHPPQKEFSMAVKKIKSLVNAYRIEAISIGNGTASRETESLIKKIPFEKDLAVFIVNEAGASVYSASKIAREEFPGHDVTVRGAVSIGRRLNDPLAELVKIDPKAIGVGQYQHEVDQVKLKEKLDLTVMSCVSRIGVNVNTASRELLSYVSGIGPVLAENVIEYRRTAGSLKTKKELLKIPRLGPKAFEQSAGFLRIKNSLNPLDDSAVHPESYHIAERISEDEKVSINELIGNKEILKKIEISKYTNDELGIPTLRDILNELEKPGADPRKEIQNFSFDPSVKKIEDLKTGMILPGLVNNITNFGCFVDLGIKESGLIHISNLKEGFVSDVNSVVKLHQQIQVKVLDVEMDRKRIQLSLVKE